MEVLEGFTSTGGHTQETALRKKRAVNTYAVITLPFLKPPPSAIIGLYRKFLIQLEQGQHPFT